VDIEVWVDELPGLEGWTELIRQPLMVSSWGVAVGDVVSDDTDRAAVVPGEYLAIVFGRPTPGPAELCMVLAST
jgi:hypothetical protein